MDDSGNRRWSESIFGFEKTSVRLPSVALLTTVSRGIRRYFEKRLLQGNLAPRVGITIRTASFGGIGISRMETWRLSFPRPCHRLEPAATPTKGMSLLLPDYTIRESARAKHVRFRITMSDGLVVVIPKGFNRKRIPELLEGRRAWLMRALEEIERQRVGMPSPERPPMTIELRAIGQSWRLDWTESGGAKVLVSEPGVSVLRVSGPTHDAGVWQSALKRWLIARGREHLIPWTHELSCQLGIRIPRVTIRCQRSRWGSYSTRGTVSLNAQLLCLPRPLARYVLIHELCHAVHPNHSQRFWRLVRQWEPDADRYRFELRHAGRLVPAWLSFGR